MPLTYTLPGNRKTPITNEVFNKPQYTISNNEDLTSFYTDQIHGQGTEIRQYESLPDLSQVKPITNTFKLPTKLNTIQSQVPKQMRQQNRANAFNKAAPMLGSAIQGARPLIQSQSKDFNATNTAIQTGLSSAGSIGLQNSKLGKGATSGLTLGSAVGGMAGDILSNEGKEEAGGFLSGAASGAAAGAMLGPWGAAAGGVIGGALGALGGKKKRRARRKREKAEELRKIKQAEQRHIEGVQADIEAQARLYDEYGNRIAVARNGLKLTAQTTFKVKFSSNTSLIPLEKEKEVIKFKRGGKTSLNKENIIPDGPTHGQLNKTNVKRDKGLAIVKDGNKEYEIEKEELVLNLKATTMAEKLCRRYAKDKDLKHLAALGKLMKRELLNNTHDYTKKFNINKGKALKETSVNDGIDTRPKEGKYEVKETDVKAEGGKMQVLGNGGEVLANIDGGARIFSRPHTKRLIELAKAAKNRDGLVTLGKFMNGVINKQDTQEKQYVEN